MHSFMTRLKYSLKSDTLFKMLFTKNQDLLKRLVAALLGIKYEDIAEFSVINPEISPEELGKKFCRLDINMTVNGQKLDLELQITDEGNYPERSLVNFFLHALACCYLRGACCGVPFDVCAYGFREHTQGNKRAPVDYCRGRIEGLRRAVYRDLRAVNYMRNAYARRS
jgi:hypothetical protein